MTDVAQQATLEGKKQEAYRVALEMYRQDPDWMTFFREVLGVDGVVRRLFPSLEEMTAFEKGEEYAGIQQMVTQLRKRFKTQEDEEKEATRVITVRLPESLHELLKAEAKNLQISMNKLCISKLLQVISEELVPAK